jgi:hypothetical protein
MGVTRRQVIIGGGAAAVLAVVGGYELVENRVLPGKTKLDKALGKCGDAPPLPTNALGPKVTGSFASQARVGKTVHWTVSYPPGHAANAELPVVIGFPGRGGTDASVFTALNVDKFMAAEVDAGRVRPFAIAAADGGAATCWHKRANGDDPASMILDEFLPLLKGRGLHTDKVGFWGQSLGGYGAVHIAMLAGSSRAAVTVGSSPALWRTFEESANGTYDNAADFAANTVFGRQAELDGIAVRLDCGGSDPFAPNVTVFRNSLTPTPAGGIAGGCHDNAFSERHLADQLKFLSDNLPA